MEIYQWDKIYKPNKDRGGAFQITEEMVQGKNVIYNLTGLQSQAKLNNSMMSSTKNHPASNEQVF